MTTKHLSSTSSGISSFSVGSFVLAANQPAWHQLAVELKSVDGSKQDISKTYQQSAFSGGTATGPSVQVPYGVYSLALNYTDANSTLLYKVCDSSAAKTYTINVPDYMTAVQICQVGNSQPVATVPVGQPPAAPAPSPQPSATGQTQIVFPTYPALPPITSNAGYSAMNGGLYQGSTQLHLKGINWFGFETSSISLHGLAASNLNAVHTIANIVDHVQALGFNALRIPLSPDAFNPNSAAVDGYSSSLAELTALLTYTAQKGMYVLLDFHTCKDDEYSSPGPALVNNPDPSYADCIASVYTEQQYTADIVALASIARQNPNVIGIDMFNEPHGYTWTDWAALVGRVGTQILAVAPNIVLFVEGVADASPFGNYDVEWGENLYEAGATVPQIPAKNLVYSPHVYGPLVAAQSYFVVPNPNAPNDPAFPANLPQIWDQHFGYLSAKGFTMIVGEFGGTFVDGTAANSNRYAPDKTWGTAFVNYLGTTKGNWFFWCINPDSGDTKGLFLDDWDTVDVNKLQILQPLLTATF